MKEEKDESLTKEKKVAEALDGHHFLGLAIESAETSDRSVDEISLPIVKGNSLWSENTVNSCKHLFQVLNFNIFELNR